VEAAEVVRVRSDPGDVPIARAVRLTIKQNLFWAAIYNVLAIPIAAGSLYRAGAHHAGRERRCGQPRCRQNADSGGDDVPNLI
jgi:cation transport ATPase